MKIEITIALWPLNRLFVGTHRDVGYFAAWGFAGPIGFLITFGHNPAEDRPMAEA